MTQRHSSAPFNGPLETGLRTVALLAAAYPRAYDLNRLVAFDYLLVHTGEVGGPESLHPVAPLQSAQILVRRQLLEDALLLMMTRGLIDRQFTQGGLAYGAGENAAPFLAALTSTYVQALKFRAAWLVKALGEESDEAFRNIMRRFFDAWIEEFQSVERSLGTES